MKIKAKHLSAIIALLSLGAIVYGFIIRPENLDGSNTYIGIGTVGLFLVAMPIFLITASRGKKIQDYMLTDENLRKMREGNRKNPENQ